MQRRDRRAGLAHGRVPHKRDAAAAAIGGQVRARRVGGRRWVDDLLDAARGARGGEGSGECGV
jgi:hypothetical protein